MLYKPDWPEARKRYEAMWRGERLDRPCLAVTAPLKRESQPPPLPEVDDEGYWLDPEFRVAYARRALESTWWGGESIPSVLQMAGWVLCLGGAPHFDRATIWFETNKTDFSRPSPYRDKPEGEWTKKYHKLLRTLCADAGHDNYMVGSPCALPANDLLAMLMGTEEFLIATQEHPEWMAEAFKQAAGDHVVTIKNCRKITREAGHAFWYGIAGWMPFWAPESFYSTQSDVSCMLSPEAFDTFILPELEMYSEAFGPIWYHLDGGDARQHLPRLLSLPFLKVLQYTPAPCEEPNGPAHLDMYRQAQAAGKIVHIEAPVSNVEPLTRALDPSLLALNVRVSSPEEGEKLIEQSVKWAGAST